MRNLNYVDLKKLETVLKITVRKITDAYKIITSDPI